MHELADGGQGGPAYPDTPAGLGDDGGAMFRLVQRLISLRRRNPWLVEARTVPTLVDNRRYEYDAVAPDGSARIHVALTLNPQPRATIDNQ